MIVSTASHSLGKHAATAPASLPDTVKRMEGMLWYELLTELNKSGLPASALGTGSDAFQGIFMWDLSQNDFGKYDGKLTAATVKQIASRAAAIPAPIVTKAAAPSTVASATAASATAASPAAAVSGSVLDRATDFARAIWPAIESAAAQLGVPAVGVLAQTALETGWGAAAGGNNLFGIKAVDGEAGTTRPTQEMIAGVLSPQLSSFRDYASPSASLADYVNLIQSAYRNVTGQSSVAGFANALQSAGYATDTGYAAKIISIAQSPLMARIVQAIGGQTLAAPTE